MTLDASVEPSPSLSRRHIMEAALALINEEGLDQFSLRKVAARLGVKAPSLYWHVSDRADLLAAVGESMFRRSLTDMGPVESWQGWLREFGVVLWRIQNATRDIGRLMLVAEYPDNVLDRLAGDLAGSLARFDLEPERGNIMQSAVQAYVTGWSNLATGPNAAYLARNMDVEAAFLAGLDALIRGFEGS